MNIEYGMEYIVFKHVAIVKYLLTMLFPSVQK